MSNVSSNLTLGVGPPEADEPFDIAVDDNDQAGSAPAIVAIGALSVVVQPGRFATVPVSLGEPLTIETPGKKRLKMFCSLSVAGTVDMSTDGGEVTYLGRRNEPKTETLSFVRSREQRLQYFYDSPEVEVISQTTFRNLDNEIVDDPEYDAGTGTFKTAGEVVGAMIVRYSPGFSLYEVTYGNGSSVASAAQFAEMENAWLTGNVYDAEVPPVRVSAISDWHASISSFERKIWPTHAPIVEYEFKNNTGVPSQYNEDSSKRITTTTRVYSDTDPTVYVDVERADYIEAEDAQTGKKFKLRMNNN